MRAFGMTRHAAERIQDMCIPPQVIRNILENPERTWDAETTMSRRTPNGPRKVYCQGKVAILVAVREQEILTVFWSGGGKPSEATWKEGDWIDY